MKEGVMDRGQDWEWMGAASGLVAAVFFVVAFAIFLSTDPGGGSTPQLPAIDNAEAVPAFVGDHLTSVRAQVMLNGLGVVTFLWFLGTLWAGLRRSESEPARGSMIVVSGALVGAAVTLVGLVLVGTATLATSTSTASAVPTLYVAASLSFAFGGAAFAVFFLGVAEVILRTHAMGKWLGYLAVVAAVLSILGLVTHYYTDGIMNPATGALGFYGHYMAFVVWLLLASVEIALAQHRRRRAERPVAETVPAAGTEGATA
jgi:hypothetical protein